MPGNPPRVKSRVQQRLRKQTRRKDGVDIADGPGRRPAFARQVPWRDLTSRSYFPFRHTCCDLLPNGEPPRTANRRLLALSSGPATVLTSVSLDRGLAIDPASSQQAHPISFTVQS